MATASRVAGAQVGRIASNIAALRYGVSMKICVSPARDSRSSACRRRFARRRGPADSRESESAGRSSPDAISASSSDDGPTSGRTRHARRMRSGDDRRAGIGDGRTAGFRDERGIAPGDDRSRASSSIIDGRRSMTDLDDLQFAQRLRMIDRLQECARRLRVLGEEVGQRAGQRDDCLRQARRSGARRRSGRAAGTACRHGSARRQHRRCRRRPASTSVESAAGRSVRSGRSDSTRSTSAMPSDSIFAAPAQSYGSIGAAGNCSSAARGRRAHRDTSSGCCRPAIASGRDRRPPGRYERRLRVPACVRAARRARVVRQRLAESARRPARPPGRIR